MKIRQKQPPYTKLAVSLALSAAMLLGGMLWVGHISAGQWVSRLLWPLSRLLLFISIGLIAGQIIEASGWTRALSTLARPMFRFGNLDDRCSVVFTTAFVSGVAANAMLLEFYEEGKIRKQELFLTNFINQLPAFFLHLPTTFFIVVPLTGLAGGLYFLLTFLATLLRTALFILYGRFISTPASGAAAAPAETTPLKTKPKKHLWEEIKLRFPNRIINIAIYVVPVYILVFVMNAKGFFKLAENWLASSMTIDFLPVEALSVVVLSFTAEFTSGFAAAGALMDAGVITVKQTVLALLIGNIIAFPIRAVRHQLPRYIGIFSPKMGTEVLLLGQTFRILSLMTVGAIYYYVA